MIPLRDLNPIHVRPVVLWAIVASNVLVFLLSYSQLNDVVRHFGAVPWHFTGLRPKLGGVQGYAVVDPFEWWFPLRAFTSAWLHGGFLHIAFNMWFLWVFGDNVEARQGRFRFVLFYLATVVAAVAAQVASDPAGAIPMVGASGAVSGVLGAYIRYFPRAKVIGLVPLGPVFFTVTWSAFAFVGMWLALQVFSVLIQPSGGGGVAWWAHIGGFAAGYGLAPLFARKSRPRVRVD